ncbi:MAG: MtnX-like HAD-IB family phosphatase [Bacteroidota bacterium]|nr:MtnX-like HAD-IB family phosphatase [Candidatus Kapabacteria bacterium]MDW8221268.1 MtnX-like HAD-IB family phosphatase [Bacteroidota bacterium]
MSKPSLYIFTDFDGTITIDDLGDTMFEVFGAFSTYAPQLASGVLSVPEYWRCLVASIHPGVTPKMLRAWAYQQPADPAFAPFVEFCRKNGIPLTVVSDGFDLYIDAVLEREGAADVPRFCNQLVLQGDSFVPVFPGQDESCSCFCASCKRNSILSSVPPDAVIIYIGDGYSDFCAAEHADIIFAKKALAHYCNHHRLPHHLFSTFSDVQSLLKNIMQRKRLKHRYQAVLRRKWAFEAE